MAVDGNQIRSRLRERFKTFGASQWWSAEVLAADLGSTPDIIRQWLLRIDDGTIEVRDFNRNGEYVARFVRTRRYLEAGDDASGFHPNPSVGPQPVTDTVAGPPADHHFAPASINSRHGPLTHNQVIQVISVPNDGVHSNDELAYRNFASNDIRYRVDDGPNGLPYLRFENGTGPGGTGDYYYPDIPPGGLANESNFKTTALTFMVAVRMFTGGVLNSPGSVCFGTRNLTDRANDDGWLLFARGTGVGAPRTMQIQAYNTAGARVDATSTLQWAVDVWDIVGGIITESGGSRICLSQHFADGDVSAAFDFNPNEGTQSGTVDTFQWGNDGNEVSRAAIDMGDVKMWDRALSAADFDAAMDNMLSDYGVTLR